MKTFLAAITLVALITLCGDIKSQTYINTNNRLPKQDTIKVIMLICNRLNVEAFGHSTPQNFIGYSVRVRWNINNEYDRGSFCFNCPDYMKHVQYLDEQKKPIPDNIIVWNSYILENKFNK